jgi:peroxiredoxin
MIHRAALHTLALTTVLIAAGAALRAPARAQDPAGVHAAKGGRQPGSLAAVDELYRKELGEVERRRIERLAALAGMQAKPEANKTYEAYFQAVIAANLFAEAEPVADRVLQSNDTSIKVVFLADVAKIMAQMGRGAYDDALASLSSMLDESDKHAAAAGATVAHPLPASARLTLLEACFQRLTQTGQYGIARKAFQMVHNRTADPAVKAFVASRLMRLEMVGKPAPAIAGIDLDGRPIRLADFRGDLVLIVFWATWCPNCAEEVARLEAALTACRDRGFRILGINLDALQEGKSPDAVRTAVREFLLEYNVAWPNLISGAGDQDVARAFGVTEVPANVLIGRDGTIIQLDLARSNLEKAVAAAVGQAAR